MMFSKRAKDAMLSLVSGPTWSPQTIGGTNNLIISIFAGSMLSQAELDLIYTQNVTRPSNLPTLNNVNTLFSNAGKTLLATGYISPVPVSQEKPRTKRRYSVEGKTLRAVASGEASFMVVAPSLDSVTSRYLYVFDLNETTPDILIKNKNIVSGQLVYLQDISIDFSIGVQR